MRIEAEDSLEVYYFLQDEMQRGKEWMLYREEGSHVAAADMFCFGSREEMAGFREKYPAFAGKFKEANLGLVMDSLSAKLKKDEELRAAKVDITVEFKAALHAFAKKPNGLLPKKKELVFKHGQKAR
jgi:hypothetical protein